MTYFKLNFISARIKKHPLRENWWAMLMIQMESTSVVTCIIHMKNNVQWFWWENSIKNFLFDSIQEIYSECQNSFNQAVQCKKNKNFNTHTGNVDGLT